MREVRVNEQSLIDIAEAIREKNKTENTYRPSEMAAAVSELPTSFPVIEDIEIVANGVYEPAEGIDGFNKVTVEVPANVTKIEVTANGTYTPEGYDGYSEVTVDVQPKLAPIEITVNGTYEATDVDGYNVVTVNTPSPTDEDLTITGDCQYRFAYGGWDWVVEKYGDRITTHDLRPLDRMFYYSNVSRIPFEINTTSGVAIGMERMFNHCVWLSEVPKISNCRPSAMNSIFAECTYLINIPEDFCDWFDWSAIDATNQSGYSGGKGNLFEGCKSLRSFPVELFAHGNPNVNYGYGNFKQTFMNCTSLDEVVDVPVNHTGTWTSNAFASCFTACFRLKRLSFAMPNGSPYVMNWKNQTIDLSSNVGHSMSVSNTTWPNLDTDDGKNQVYNSMFSGVNPQNGISPFDCMYDDATYQEHKDNPGSWAVKVEYSRYNHTSAVETINTLPDTSAYLAANGGTNAIKFTGQAGSLTEGGAINTLTEEEIAVATAKGWTVTFA